MAKSGDPGSARAMETWLGPFAAMFTQPTWLNAVALATGALLCLNRRTVCACTGRRKSPLEADCNRHLRPVETAT